MKVVSESEETVVCGMEVKREKEGEEEWRGRRREKKNGEGLLHPLVCAPLRLRQSFQKTIVDTHQLLRACLVCVNERVSVCLRACVYVCVCLCVSSCVCAFACCVCVCICVCLCMSEQRCRRVGTAHLSVFLYCVICLSSCLSSYQSVCLSTCLSILSLVPSSIRIFQ
jgi:hypothetical protein